MTVSRIQPADRHVPPGEAFFDWTGALRSHAGTQPDLFLRWNAIPASAQSIDVVVHLHGFSQEREAMPLAEKVPRSGLDLTNRARPTLAVLPRGNWLGRTWYDFPALLGGGLDRLVDDALDRFAQAVAHPLTLPSPPEGERVVPASPLRVDRLILTAHSGGGMPAIDAVVGSSRAPDEIHIFDGLYGRDPAAGDPLAGVEIVERWLAGRLAAEPQRPGALRVVYIERQTGPFSRAVGDVIARHLAATPAALVPDLSRRYRIGRSAVPHGYVAAICGPVLLADPGADLDWSRIV